MLALADRRRGRAGAARARPWPRCWLAFPVAYLLFMLRSELFFVRFALPVVPFLCLLAAVAVVAVRRDGRERRPALARRRAPRC